MNKDDKVYLNICSLNIQGLAKYEEDSELKEFLSKFDLIGLCETPGISRYRSQHVPVGSSSLLHHSI